MRDYFRKCGFKKAVIGLSGGIDSALTTAIAVRALGPDRVVGITMPSRYSSDGSVLDSQQLAALLGIDCHVFRSDQSMRPTTKNSRGSGRGPVARPRPPV